MTELTTLLTAICLGLLVAAAMRDIATRQIPNWLPLALAGVGFILRARYGDLLSGMSAAIVVFLLAGFCWWRGWLGGGDVKLIGAAALAVPAGLVASFVFTIGLAGGVLALGYLVGRRCASPGRGRQAVPHIRERHPRALIGRVLRVERRRISRGGPLPYAVAIAVAGVLALVQANSR